MSTTMNYSLYRLKDTEGNERRRFMASAYLQITGSWPPKPDDYEKIYEGTLTLRRIYNSGDILDTLYTKFNLYQPEDFHHYSMSVGDIVILTDTENPGAHFCDPIGFTEVLEFYAALTATN